MEIITIDDEICAQFENEILDWKVHRYNELNKQVESISKNIFSKRNREIN